MRIDYAAIQDKYKIGKDVILRGDQKATCCTCKKSLDIRQFFKTSRAEKFKHGVLPECKTCATMGVIDTDPSTFLSILKDIDVPYIPSEWRALVLKKVTGSASIIGKYVSKMRLNQWKKYKWADSEELARKEEESILAALRQETETETEAEQKLNDLLSMNDIKNPTNNMASFISISNGGPSDKIAQMYGLTPETSKYNLTWDEINELKRTWGENYTEDEYLNVEQQFINMQQAYIINDPLAITNARIICKFTVKLNSSLDINDFESASKIGRQLDNFIKTANLAPVQQKDRQQSTFAISQLALLVEKEGGFVPEYCTNVVNDKIDRVLADMKEYTEYLVRGETSIGELLENTEAILAQDNLPKAEEDRNDFAALEAELLGDMLEIEEAQDEFTS